MGPAGPAGRAGLQGPAGPAGVSFTVLSARSGFGLGSPTTFVVPIDGSPVPIDGTLSRLTVASENSQSNVEGLPFRVAIAVNPTPADPSNNAVTTLTCTLLLPTVQRVLTCSDTVNRVSITAGSTITVQFSFTDEGTVGAEPAVSLVLESDLDA